MFEHCLYDVDRKHMINKDKFRAGITKSENIEKANLCHNSARIRFLPRFSSSPLDFCFTTSTEIMSTF